LSTSFINTREIELCLSWTQQVCGGVHESVFACVVKVGIIKVLSKMGVLKIFIKVNDP
jgi:hypothetical protein